MSHRVAWLRCRQLRAAAAPLLRSVRWQPVLLVGGLAAGLLWWRWGDLGDPTVSLWLLRGVALMLAAAVPFGLDDGSRGTLAASPTPLSSRTAGALLVVVLPAAAVWAAACAAVSRQATGLPLLGLTLEAMALCCASTAAGLALARWRDAPEPGALTAPAVVVLGLVLPQLPRWAAVVVGPGPDWQAAHLRWAAVLALAVAVSCAAVADPGRGGATRPRWPRDRTLRT